MGKIMDNKFNQRYGGKICVVYSEKRESPARQKERNGELSKAFEAVLSGISGRTASPKELLGIKKLSR